MNDVTCPYNKMTLQIASMGLEKKLTEELSNKLAEEINKQCDITNEAELKKSCAEHHGITLEMLINSPNYEKLMSEFWRSLFHKTLEVLKSNGFSNEEAWAFVALGTGELGN